MVRIIRREKSSIICCFFPQMLCCKTTDDLTIDLDIVCLLLILNHYQRISLDDTKAGRQRHLMRTEDGLKDSQRKGSARGQW